MEPADGNLAPPPSRAQRWARVLMAAGAALSGAVILPPATESVTSVDSCPFCAWAEPGPA